MISIELVCPICWVTHTVDASPAKYVGRHPTELNWQVVCDRMDGTTVANVFTPIRDWPMTDPRSPWSPSIEALRKRTERGVVDHLTATLRANRPDTTSSRTRRVLGSL